MIFGKVNPSCSRIAMVHILCLDLKTLLSLGQSKNMCASDYPRESSHPLPVVKNPDFTGGGGGGGNPDFSGKILILQGDILILLK